MKAPPPQGEGIVRVVAALAVAAIQIAQPQRVVCRFSHSGARRRPRADVAPEARDAHRQGQHRKPEHHAKHQRQRVVREHGIEVAGHGLMKQSARHQHGQHQKQRQAAGGSQRQDQPVALVQRAQRGGPGVVGVGLHAHLGHGLRHVHREFMRRRVLAGVQTGAAVVAQVGQVVQVGLAEFQSARHRRKHRAEPFAIAAGVAYLHDARDFGFVVGQQVGLRLGGLAQPAHGLFGHGRAGGRLGMGGGKRLRLAGQGFKLLHIVLFARVWARAAAAARVPAIRPNAVPMDMPTPAV
ncbi:hypothetical protein D3C72_742680 [compost metagenome]